MLRRFALAFLPVVLLATSCQVARAGTRCRGNGLAQDSSHVLGCRGGRWVRLATKVEVAQRIAEQIRLNQQAAAEAARATPPPLLLPPPNPTVPPPAVPDDSVPPNDADPTFGAGGLASLHSGLALHEIAPGPGGTILLVFHGAPTWPHRGIGRSAAIVRLLPDGAVDARFGVDGWWRGEVDSVTIAGDGRPVLLDLSWRESTRQQGAQSVPVQVTERVVRKLTLDGREVTSPVSGVDVWRWTTQADTPSLFGCVASIEAVRGDLYVLFGAQHLATCSPTGLDRIDAAGNVTASWGAGGPAPTDATAPLAVGAGPDGGLVVGVRDNARQGYLIDAAGRYDPTFVPPPLPIEEGPPVELQASTTADGTVVMVRADGGFGSAITTHDRSGAYHAPDPSRPTQWRDAGADAVVVHGNRILVAARLTQRSPSWPSQPGVRVLRTDLRPDGDVGSTVTLPMPSVLRHMRVAVVDGRLVGVGQSADGSVWVARARVPLG